MSVYVAKVFTATLTGSRVVDCACERCATPYHYALVRQGTGKASAHYYLFQAAAERRAAAAASKDLEKRLAREVEPVACPGCGWVNASSVASFRRRHHRGFTTAAWTLATACAIAFILMRTGGTRPLRDHEWVPMFVLAAGFALAVGGGLLVVQYLLRRRFDPNRDFPTPRLPVGTPVAWRDGEAPTAAITGTAAAAGADDRVVVFRMGTLVLPEVCCECLGAASTTYSSPFKVDNNEIALPICDACRRQLRRRWWRIGLASTAVVCWLALVLYYALPNDPQGGRAGPIAIAIVVAAIGVPVTLAFVPTWRVRPYRFRVVDASRGLAKIRFRNAGYAALSAAATDAET